jgi:hypothetical protein
MRKKKEKSLYDQIRKPMPPPGRLIMPKKGKGVPYSRKKEKSHHGDNSERPRDVFTRSLYFASTPATMHA